MKTHVTTTDVATRAGVSQSTVSCVLSGKGNISAEVRDRVLAAAQELGYISRRSGAAQRRKKKQRKTIGIILDLNPPLPFVWNFERPILYHLEANLSEEGFTVVVIPISFTRSEEELYQKIVGQRVDALVSILFVNESVFNKLNGEDIPVLVIMNDALQTKFHAVLVDDFQGIFDGTTYLVELGHKNLLYIDYERPDMPALIIDRFYGFAKAVEHFHLDFPERHHIRSGTTNIEELTSLLEPIFGEPDPPTAIIALDDYIAASLLLALQRLRLGVPEQVSLLSIGDVLDYSQPYIPRITTAQINNALAGKLAGELLIDIMKKGLYSPQILKVTPRIVERGSCRRINGADTT
jgi:DNA-binding LacI/PurR family transcriptional regulator